MASQDVTVELWWSSAWHELDNVRIDPLAMTRGRAGEDDTTPPQTVTMTLMDPDQRFNPRNAASDLYGLIGRNTPARISIGGTARISGEVASWLPRRTLDYDLPAVLAGDISDKGAAWVEVVVAGPLRRLGAGEPAQDSAERRAVLALGPEAYWPLEDAQDSPAAASAVTGVNPMRPIGTSQYTAPVTGAPIPPAGLPRFGQGLSPAGSRPGVSLTEGGRLDGQVPQSSSGNWEVHWDMAFGLNAAGVASSEALWVVSAEGGVDKWIINADNTQVTVFGEQAGGVVITLTTGVSPYDGVAHHYALACDDNGAQVDAWLYVDGVQVDLASVGATDFYPVSKVVVNGLEDTGDHMPIGMSHVAVFQPLLNNTDERDGLAWAAHGHPGEPAGERVERLCGEEGLAFASTGTMADTEPMGPQPALSVVALLAECAATDMGILYESTASAGIHYKARAELYNQTPALTLDYSAGQIAPGLDIDLDDRATGNDITVRRADGATAHASLETGHPMAVDQIGRVRRSPDVNVPSEGQLDAQAGWRLHMGTWNEARYPRLTVDLDADPDLVADVEALRPGNMIEVTGLDHNPVALIIQGWTETVGTHRRLVEFNCTPAAPWSIAEVEHDSYGYIGSDGSTLNSTFNAGGSTSMSVAVAAGYPLWATGSVDLDVMVSGVRLHVTSISGASSPQTFTVTLAAVNGISKSIAAGAKVDVHPPAYIGM